MSVIEIIGWVVAVLGACIVSLVLGWLLGALVRAAFDNIWTRILWGTTATQSDWKNDSGDKLKILRLWGFQTSRFMIGISGVKREPKP